MQSGKNLKILHAPNNITGAPRNLATLERRRGLKSDSINTTVVEPDGQCHFNSKDNLISKIYFRIKYFFLALIYFLNVLLDSYTTH